MISLIAALLLSAPFAQAHSTCEAQLSVLNVLAPILDTLEAGKELRASLFSSPDNALWIPWRRALVHWPEIRESLNARTGEDKAYFERIVRATEAALGKHQLEYIRERRPQTLDFPRHLEILKQIAAFDILKPQFSLYKIKRAIEGRHSLTEYIECR